VSPWEQRTWKRRFIVETVCADVIVMG
jgi:hypothetical protein